MRIDVVTVFPDYLRPLELSLIGKARETDLLDIRVHDLRQWANDRHRTVDDSPYGGGPGMVMRADVWGDALDTIRVSGEVEPLLVIPTPSGTPFDHRTAATLSHSEWIVIACGRYEGIDARVGEHYRRREDWHGVQDISLGDYVVAGGEVAALVLVEAVGRLIPGVLGNEESAARDSFGEAYSGILEAPAYTRPEEWRGLRVPEVLLSGNHARVAIWRDDEARRRTAEIRPGLLNPGPE
jgi:tRNA (guanine37-N1)-methyltransferase